jgi:hypothetical protein
MPPREAWGVPLYGDPCRECGFAWSLFAAEAVALVGGLPDRLDVVLPGSDGRARHPALEWNVSAYVAHMADNLRIWSEQFAGVLAGGDAHVPGYDEKVLAEARHYNDIPVASTLWAVRQSVGAWATTMRAALEHGVLLLHAGRGDQRAADVLMSNTHDLYHHEWDIGRCLTAAYGGSGAGAESAR